MKKIILDTDIGDDVDDALALAFALLCGEIELVGVTTVFRDTARRAELACCILDALGRGEVPVYAGLGKPLFDPASKGKADIEKHRPRQMEAIRQYPGPSRPAAGRAVDFIVDTVMGSGGEITLVPIGPLTNIAAALTVEPRLAQKTSICLMGGCIGNMRAEWNILCDPEAAHVVFGAGAPITMVGLDVTEKCRLDNAQVQAIGDAGRPINRLCFDLIQLWRGDSTLKHPILHDPLAVAMVFDPAFCETRPTAIHVETRSDRLNGATVPIRSDAFGTNAEVCVDMDSGRFVSFFVNTLTS
ncbi:MAG: nucleoside hydrolase [Gemmatimonadota bacterium]|nr:nucleoside hydrolase [Gemmatimonadota bacterium]